MPLNDPDLPVVYVCQVQTCPRFDVPRPFVWRWWLIAPSVEDPGVLVIRCPEHYTEWALRLTVYGRLNTLMDHAREARALELPPWDNLLVLPTRFLGAERGDAQDDVPDPRTYLDDVVRQPVRKRWRWTYTPEEREATRLKRAANAPQPRGYSNRFAPVEKPSPRRKKKQQSKHPQPRRTRHGSTPQGSRNPQDRSTPQADRRTGGAQGSGSGGG